MAGHLQIHPFYKSWDELQRTHKRMKNYLDMNFNLLDEEGKERLQIMLEGIEKAMHCVPEDYRVTKHHYTKEKN
jgi:uncharacterized protein YsxB (DUF464 family)